MTDEPSPAPPLKLRAIPTAHRARFDEVTALIARFGDQHLDAELTGFALELWQRICRRKKPDCTLGQPTVWAATVWQVIARMNFLFDPDQPGHLASDTIRVFFQTTQSTLGRKATEIERTLKLEQHSEPGLCRRVLLEMFTMIELSNGLVMPWKTAKEMGYLPSDAQIENLK